MIYHQWHDDKLQWQHHRQRTHWCAELGFGNGMILPHSMDFSYLQHAWDAANITLQDLMGPVADRAVNKNDRCCPICLDLVLLLKFGIPSCGHPIHMRCLRLYRDQLTAHNQVVACPVC